MIRTLAVLTGAFLGFASALVFANSVSTDVQSDYPQGNAYGTASESGRWSPVSEFELALAERASDEPPAYYDDNWPVIKETNPKAPPVKNPKPGNWHEDPQINRDSDLYKLQYELALLDCFDGPIDGRWSIAFHERLAHVILTSELDLTRVHTIEEVVNALHVAEPTICMDTGSIATNEPGTLVEEYQSASESVLNGSNLHGPDANAATMDSNTSHTVSGPGNGRETVVANRTSSRTIKVPSVSSTEDINAGAAGIELAREPVSTSPRVPADPFAATEPETQPGSFTVETRSEIVPTSNTPAPAIGSDRTGETHRLAIPGPKDVIRASKSFALASNTMTDARPDTTTLPEEVAIKPEHPEHPEQIEPFMPIPVRNTAAKRLASAAAIPRTVAPRARSGKRGKTRSSRRKNSAASIARRQQATKAAKPRTPDWKANRAKIFATR